MMTSRENDLYVCEYVCEGFSAFFDVRVCYANAEF